MAENLKIMVGVEETTVEVLPNGGIWFDSEPEVGRTVRKLVSVEDAALLVMHLVGELSIFSDKSFYAVEEDVATLRGRLIHNKKVENLMKNLSAGYFKRDLSKLSGNEFELIRRTAEAEIAVAEAEAEGKL